MKGSKAKQIELYTKIETDNKTNENNENVQQKKRRKWKNRLNSRYQTLKGKTQKKEYMQILYQEKKMR